MMANVDAMGPFDESTLIVAAYMVALSVVIELKDIKLVSIAVDQAGDKISSSMRRAFLLLNGIRRWLFLPGLLMSVPMLVMLMGGARPLPLCFCAPFASK